MSRVEIYQRGSHPRSKQLAAVLFIAPCSTQRAGFGMHQARGLSGTRTKPQQNNEHAALLMLSVLMKNVVAGPRNPKEILNRCLNEGSQRRWPAM